MSRVEVERGRRYYCEVVGAGEPLRGTFVIEDDDVRASLVRFDAFLPHEHEGPLHLRMEGNWYASMFDLVPAGWTRNGGGAANAFVRNTSSNVTLVGWDVWTEADLVRRLTFRIPGL